MERKSNLTSLISKLVVGIAIILEMLYLGRPYIRTAHLVMETPVVHADEDEDEDIDEDVDTDTDEDDDEDTDNEEDDNENENNNNEDDDDDEEEGTTSGYTSDDDDDDLITWGLYTALWYDDTNDTSKHFQHKKHAKELTAKNYTEKNTVQLATQELGDTNAEGKSVIFKIGKDQSKQMAKQPNLPATKPMVEYTLTKYNDGWIPFWYQYTVLQKHSKLPQNHPANVKANKKTVKGYRKYMQKKTDKEAAEAKSDSQKSFWEDILGVVLGVLLFAGAVVLVVALFILL